MTGPRCQRQIRDLADGSPEICDLPATYFLVMSSGRIAFLCDDCADVVEQESGSRAFPFNGKADAP